MPGPSPGRGVLVKMEGITKRFPGVIANDRVDFELRAGEVHALLGENGAGKTTLMNILYGLYRPDSGRIYVMGREVNIKSPKDAIELGIGMVHQHFRLVPTLTVAENMALGLKEAGFFMPARRLEERIEAIAEHYGLRVDPRAKIWQLSIGERQRVEILKLLIRDARVLILDEPTTVLTPKEKEGLFKVMRKLAYEGRGIVFITHKLDEVFYVADRVTVLRKGRVVAGHMPVEETSPGELARLMVGQPITAEEGKRRRLKELTGEVVLEVSGLSVMNDKGLMAVRDVSFEVREGEVFGIAGVAGNGQKELVEALIGLRKPVKGKIKIRGRDVTGKTPADTMELGVAFIPEDRARLGVALGLSVAENLILRDYRRRPFRRGPFLDIGYIREWANKLVAEYGITTPSLDTPAGALSGGNVQRLILARELSRKPKLIIASHPTYGLDVAATKYIRSLLLAQRDAGAGILLVSEDLDEVLELSDRVGVMRDGRIVGIVRPSEIDMETLGLMMSGGTEEGEWC